MRTPIIAVTGRFQPFHSDHLELILSAASDCGRVIIGITNPDARSRVEEPQSPHRHRNDANPFTYFERQEMVARSLRALLPDRLTIVPFPLDTPQYWCDYIPRHAIQLVRTFAKWEDRKVEILRAGGYEVRAIPGDVDARISASDIRAAMAAGTAWHDWVPAGTASVLSAMGDEELMRRCTADAPDG